MPYHQPNKLEPLKGNRFHFRRILHYWPLLIWIGMIMTAIWGYQQGVVFRRMNGAVDPYQENVAPSESGNFKQLGKGIERGVRVKEGQPVAYMDTSAVDDEIRAVLSEIEIQRQSRLRDFDNDLRKLSTELRKITADQKGSDAEADALQKAADDVMASEKARIEALRKNPGFANALLPANNEIASKYLADVSKLRAKSAVYAIQLADAQKEHDDLVKERLALEKLNLDKVDDILLIAGHSQAVDYQELQAKKGRMVLTANTSGIVDRIMKEPGEYVKAGEGILKIVGDPTQIIGFLPEDQLNQIHVGKKVWITPSHDRTHAYESKILFLAPRMNSLRDSTSPLPNKLLHGRDIICEYPAEAMIPGSTPGGEPTYLLLPGQTVTIHIEKPGTIPLINQIFRNDDTN